jgi:hypothetical protein
VPVRPRLAMITNRLFIQTLLSFHRRDSKPGVRETRSAVTYQLTASFPVNGTL